MQIVDVVQVGQHWKNIYWNNHKKYYYEKDMFAILLIKTVLRYANNVDVKFSKF